MGQLDRRITRVIGIGSGTSLFSGAYIACIESSGITAARNFTLITFRRLPLIPMERRNMRTYSMLGPGAMKLKAP
jgi:hypothetical protein